MDKIDWSDFNSGLREYVSRGKPIDPVIVRDCLDRLEAAEAQVAELRRVLDMVEWVYKSQMSDWFHEGDVCAWCDGYKEDGHTHDCPRQKALGME